MPNEDKPHLTLVDPQFVNDQDREFVPLPFYPFDQRPDAMPLDPDEGATAIHLANGDIAQAAALLKVPIIRLNRLIRGHPRLKRVLDESLGVVLAKAASVPIQTLFDPAADARRLEWAATKVLQSRLAIGHPLSPAPPSTTAASLTLDQPNRSITFRWRTDADDLKPDDDDSAV
jgi:hypothetical protein